MKNNFLTTNKYSWLIFIGAVSSFIILALFVQENQILPGEPSFLLTIHSLADSKLDQIILLVTNFGTKWGVLPLTIIFALYFFVQKQWKSGLYLLTSMIGCFLISYSTKIFFSRPRPHLWELSYPLPADYSFPSGHALISLTFVVTLFLLFWSSRWRWLVGIIGGIFALVIASTRLYLGVHFPSDILGGWLLAIAWTTTVYQLFKPEQTV